MNKIIGGLLVVSLLSRPSDFGVDFLAYQLFIKENKVVVVIHNDVGEDKQQEKDINTVLARVSENGRAISALLKEKNGLNAKLEANLEFLRCAGINLSETQMDAYAGFMRVMRQENGDLASTLNKLNAGKDLSVLKKELLHNDADYDVVYDELIDIDETQQDAIERLNRIVEQGEYALGLL